MNRHAAILLLASTTCVLAGPIDPNKFDLDQNGLDAKERKAICLHAASTFYQTVDRNRNGIIEDSEIEEAKGDAEAQAEINQKALAEDAKSKGQPEWKDGPVPVADVVAVTPEAWLKADSGEYYPFYGLQLRRSMDDVDLDRWGKKNNKGKYQESLKAAKAAEFGFTHNDVTGDDAWFARGVIARPFRLHEDDATLLLVPSIQFDRVSHSVTKAAEIDSLIGDLSIAGVFTGGGLIETHLIRGGAQYATNFDFDGGIYGGKLEWEPLFSPEKLPFSLLSNGQYSGLFGAKSPLLYRMRQYLHVEGGGIDGRADASASGDYLRGGAGAALDVTFRSDLGLISRLSFSAAYQYYFDLLDGGDDFDSFKAQAQWRLDEVGHILLQASYEKGLIPLSHQEVDLISVSLGVKF